MRYYCGVVKSNAPQKEFAKLSFELAPMAVGEAGNRRKTGQCRRQCRVMREPEQVQGIAADPHRVARRNRGLELCGEHRPDQLFDLGVDQASELAVIEMAARHQPEPLLLLLIGGYLKEVTHHAPHQFDQG